MTLGNLLKARRESMGLSLNQLAIQVHISRPYLSRLERGEYAHPSPRILAQLAQRLQIRLEDLYALTGYMRAADLPSFGPYLRAKHPNWPELYYAELSDFYEFLKYKHSLR